MSVGVTKKKYVQDITNCDERKVEGEDAPATVHRNPEAGIETVAEHCFFEGTDDVDIDPVVVAPSLGETEAPPHVEAPVDGEIDTAASHVGETEAAVKLRRDKNWCKFCLGKGNTCTKFGRQNGLCKACTRAEMAMETA